MRAILFILGVLAFIAVAFFFLNSKPFTIPKNFNDATKTARCEKFRVVDPGDPGIYSLGYKGRIEQLLNGCF